MAAREFENSLSDFKNNGNFERWLRRSRAPRAAAARTRSRSFAAATVCVVTHVCPRPRSHNSEN